MKIHSSIRDFLLILLTACGFLLAVINVEAPRYRSDVILAVMLAIILASLLETYRRLQNRIDKVLKRQQVDYSQIESLFDIYSTLKFEAPLPASRFWAVSPDMARILLQEIYRHQPQTVLECGSGLSTLLMAAAMKKNGLGKLRALEHDAAQAERTRIMLAEHQLESWAEVIHAPLVNHEIQGRSYAWYDLSALDFSLSIDLLFIDGPPHHDGFCTRYPTLPLLKPMLTEKTLIILDDAGHPPEQSTVMRWSREFEDFSSEYRSTEYGTHLIRLSPPNGKTDTARRHTSGY